MKHKTWFRLVLKATGILLIGIYLGSAVSVGLFVIDFLATEILLVDPWFPDTWQYSWPQYLGHLLSFVFGLYLLFGGKWLLNRCIPSNRPYCPECGYDVSRVTGAQCPECGVMLPARAAHTDTTGAR